MADNTAQARKKVDGHRRAIRDHISKYERYPDPNDKAFAVKTIQRAQAKVKELVGKHPTLTSSWEDSWRP